MKHDTLESILYVGLEKVGHDFRYGITFHRRQPYHIIITFITTQRLEWGWNVSIERFISVGNGCQSLSVSERRWYNTYSASLAGAGVTARAALGTAGAGAARSAITSHDR